MFKTSGWIRAFAGFGILFSASIFSASIAQARQPSGVECFESDPGKIQSITRANEWVEKISKQLVDQVRRHEVLDAVRKVPSDPCSPERMAKASTGYTCQAGKVTWRVESQTFEGQRVYMDMNSGLKVTQPLEGVNNQAKAEERCGRDKGFRLPTGYPADQDRFHDGQASDFATLDRDGVLQVVLGMKSKCFWSSSIVYFNVLTHFLSDPGALLYCTYEGASNQLGDTDDPNSHDGYNRTLCVSGP